MHFKKLTEKPVLAIGILFMVIFLTTSGGKLIHKFFPGYRQRLSPTYCSTLIAKLNPRLPANWRAECNKNNLNVVIAYKFPNVPNLDLKTVRTISYRELANSYTFLAKNSPYGALEKTDIVSVRLESDYLKLNSISEGQFVIKLSSLTRKEMIKQHIHSTIQVQEVKKDKTPKE